MTSQKSRARYAIITGANGGIGQALVKEFVDTGYRVLAIDLHETCSSHGVNVEYLQVDLDRYVNDTSYAEICDHEIRERVTNDGLSALVNNAAVQILSPLSALTREKWRRTMNVNVSAPFFLIQAMLPILERNSGSVVNISSIHAQLTKPEFAAYATSKSALSSLTRNIAVDPTNRVRINAIEPAAVNTPMLNEGFKDNIKGLNQLNRYHPLQRIADPIEIAQLAVFLCSKNASFIHGECIRISGGIHGCLNDPI